MKEGYLPTGEGLERQDSRGVLGREIPAWILKHEDKFVKGGSNGRKSGSQQKEGKRL